MRGSVGAGGGGSRRLPGAPRRDDPQPVDAADPSAHLTHRTGPNTFRPPAVTWRTNMPWPQQGSRPGQLVVNPLVGEVRAHRATMATLLRQLKLPDLDEGVAEVRQRSRSDIGGANALKKFSY